MKYEVDILRKLRKNNLNALYVAESCFAKPVLMVISLGVKIIRSWVAPISEKYGQNHNVVLK